MRVCNWWVSSTLGSLLGKGIHTTHGQLDEVLLAVDELQCPIGEPLAHVARREPFCVEMKEASDEQELESETALDHKVVLDVKSPKTLGWDIEIARQSRTALMPDLFILNKKNLVH